MKFAALEGLVGGRGRGGEARANSAALEMHVGDRAAGVEVLA